MVRRLTLGLLFVIVQAMPSYSHDVAFTECDRQTAYVYDLKRVGDPVPLKDIKSDSAIPACLSAISAEQGNNRLVFQLGRSYLAGGKWFSGIQNLRRSAESGYAAAQLTLGLLYEFGQFGMIKDRKEAAVWYLKAAEQENARAQFRLASMSSQDHNKTRAFGWYCRAAENGDADAQASLGIAYLNGTAWSGAPSDPGWAVAWLRKAASQGHKGAQQDLNSITQRRLDGRGRGNNKCKEVLDCFKSGRVCH